MRRRGVDLACATDIDGARRRDRVLYKCRVEIMSGKIMGVQRPAIEICVAASKEMIARSLLGEFGARLVQRGLTGGVTLRVMDVLYFRYFRFCISPR